MTTTARELAEKQRKVNASMRNRWIKMIHRCTDRNDKSYRYYGGRGITVCKRWISSYENFVSDMGFPPSPQHSLDRINNNGNYTPKNCRWATKKEQARNTRFNKNITFNGETHCLEEWANKLNMSGRSLSERLEKWPLKKAMTFPVGRQITFRGKTMRAYEWAKETGLTRMTIAGRLKRGWTVQETLTTRPLGICEMKRNGKIVKRAGQAKLKEQT